MLARSESSSDTGAGQPVCTVALIMTRMASALARIRPRRVLRAARKREGSGKRITGCDERKVGLIENTACDDVTSLLYSLETKAADDDVHC